MSYGKAPELIGNYPLDGWDEYMHYMYLPVIMPERPGLRLPERLSFAADMVQAALDHEAPSQFTYTYVTARRGYATPGNPLNRPGWHADGFGTDDINYVWTDRYPTHYAIQDFDGISDEHSASMTQFAEQIDPWRVRTYQDRDLLRLDQHVIHSAPEIPAPGGERSFFKISFSNNRYNLAGNSHNYLFDYKWDMHPRNVVRNDPARQDKDAA